MGADINHASRAHALLSASGAERWMNCTPSARFEEPFPSKSSSFADEGTLAHEFAELGVKLEAGFITNRIHSVAIDILRKDESYTDEMEDEVEKHIAYVMEQYGDAKRVTPDAKLMVEEKLDMTEYIENGFGTGDDLIIADGVMEIIDLKYGKGIKVMAERNPQLMLYGLGAYSKYGMMYDIHTVKLTVVQPRLDSISSWEIAIDELLMWGEDEVMEKAKLAYAGEGEHKPGSWCKFCKAKSSCKALAKESLATAKLDFEAIEAPGELATTPAVKLTENEILNIFEKADIISDWLNSVKTFVLQEALSGREWEGFKLVEGRSVRKITDEVAMRTGLNKLGYTEEQITSTKLISLTAIEKLVGKATFSTELGALVTKPQGAPTLVPLSDKRPIFSSAEADFK